MGKSFGKLIIKITAVIAVFAAINVVLAKIFKKVLKVSVELDDIKEDELADAKDTTEEATDESEEKKDDSEEVVLDDEA